MSAYVGAAQATEGGPPESAGRPHEVVGNSSPRWMAVHDRTRLTGRLVRRFGHFGLWASGIELAEGDTGSGFRRSDEGGTKMNQFGRIGLMSASVAVISIAGVGSAWAHECFVANRSAQGNAAVGAHSAAWDEVSLHTVLTEFIGLPDDLAACVEAGAPAAGVPSSFVFGGKQAQGQGGVIAENNPNFSLKGLASDGKGIDHGEEAYGPAIGGLIAECSG